MNLRDFVLSILLAFIAVSFASPSRGIGWQHVDIVGPAASLQMPKIPTKLVSFETTEGTNLNVDVSPDGKTLTFDLLGDIYLLPASGGEAMSLTTGHAWDQAPRFSPDGESVYFVSDRKGYKNIWRVGLDDRSVRQVTTSTSHMMGTPNWSQDGTHLIAAQADDQGGNETVVQSIDPKTGHMTPLEKTDGRWINRDTFEYLRDRIVTFSGVQAANSEVYVAEAKPNADYSKTSVRIYRIDSATRERHLVTPTDAPYNEFKPQLSHDGKLLAYLRQYNDRRTELWILHRDTGQDHALFKLSDADDASYYASHELWPNYAFTPDDQHIVLWQAGRIHRVRLDDGASEIIPFRAKVEREVWARVEPSIQKIKDIGEAQIVRWPSVSGDGQIMVFAAIGYVWVMDMETGDMRRLTDGTDFEYMPALSPDGASVAYISFAQLEEGYGPARLVVVSIDGAASRELLTATDGMYLLPKWSEDGTKIALIREVPQTTGRGGGVHIEAMFGWTDAQEGAFREVAPAPVSGSRGNLYIYARAVGFDPSGETLWFSYPVSINETVLTTANLDGSAVQTLATGSEIGGIAPAPDLKHLALTDRYGAVWVIPFAIGEDPTHVSTSSADARRISISGGYYVDWTRADQITFSFSQNFYRYDVADTALEVRPIKVSFEKPDAAQPITFKGARLITVSGDDGVGRVIESGTIVMEGQRITAIGPQGQIAIPDNALVVDVTGKTILPGLLDTHYHRIGGSGGPARGLSAFKLPYPKFEDITAMAYGVTSAWEPAGPFDDGVPATADLQAAGRIAGPRWSYAAFGAVGYPYEHLTSYGAAFAAVRHYKDLGVDTLKEYDAPTRKQRQRLSIAAHEQGLGIVSHIDHFDGFMTRVVDGYTGGDHPYVPAPLFKDVQELLKQTGYIWTPNIVITPGTVGTGGDKNSYYWQEVLKSRPDELEKLKAITSHDREVSEPSLPYELHRVSRVAKAAADAAKYGANIGVSAHNMPGAELHREMWYLWKGGLPIEDVLRAATIGNAEKLGLHEEVGSLEVGKIADFLVLDENPLEDIINTLSIEYTVQGGVVYDSDTAERLGVSKLSLAGDSTTVH